MRALLTLLILGGCGTGARGEGCTEPALFYPDADGDGLGEPTGSYFGCTPPADWVSNADDPPTDTAVDTGTTHTGTPADTATDTAVTDTAVADTAVTDTAVADTGDTAGADTAADTASVDTAADTGP